MNMAASFAKVARHSPLGFPLVTFGHVAFAVTNANPAGRSERRESRGTEIKHLKKCVISPAIRG